MSILLLESIQPDARALLESYDLVQHASDLDAVALHNVEAVVTRGRGRVTATLIRQCPSLRVIARCGAGLDNIDLKAASAYNIPVIHAPDKTAFAVAEHTLMAILALARQLEVLTQAVRTGQWSIRSTYTGLELRGKTLGILGMGSIGRRVASLADAFGMQVIYWNRSQSDVPYTNTTIEGVLSQSDVVSLHVALTAETQNLVEADKLDLMKPTAFLVNMARGGLVNETVLLKALDEERLAGYAADLLAEDPPPVDHPLLSHPKALITPHSAVLTDVTYRDICMYTAQNVLAVLQNSAPEPASIYRQSVR